ncbi:MAG: enoyl-CoA hydratase-related protein [Actinomycetia bacterium]|nr:enoyl-CoA hydratase-related protein [Actinomycetes bacterium]
MQLVRLETTPDVATLTLDNPSTRNALSLDMMHQVTAAITQAGATQARVVVLAASGPVFSAGHHLGELVGLTLPQATAFFEACVAMIRAIRAIPQPVIARVHGPAAAGGCQLVASCDLAVAASSATFSLPGIRRGLFCHTPLVAVSRAVLPKRAFEMALTGEAITAEVAAQWGLVNRCVPDDELDDAVASLIRLLVDEGSPYARGLGKQTFYAQVGLPEAQAYELAVPMVSLNAVLPDAQEGFAAFVAKRAPHFTMGPHA